MKSVKVEGYEEVSLVIRSVNGIETLFTTDGKLLANQGDGGHIFYQGDNPRYKTFRTAFLVDGINVDMGSSIK